MGSFPKYQPFGSAARVDVPITHVNDVRVRSERDLEDALGDANEGDIVSIQTYRFRSDTTGFARIRIR